jgi:hypothetical protein
MKTTNSNSNSGLTSRAERLGSNTLPQINLARRRANQGLTTDRLLGVLRSEAPRFYHLAEVVGSWVWIQFDAKQPSNVTRALSEFGFHWNRNRQAWQHPCRSFRTKASPTDPRAKYRSYFPSDTSRA